MDKQQVDSPELRNQMINHQIDPEVTLSAVQAADPFMSQAYVPNSFIREETIVYSTIKNYALFSGIVMLILGVMSFVMPGQVDTLDFLKVNAAYGNFLTYIPMNVFNKMALIFFGTAGILCSSRDSFSLAWTKVVFVVMGVLAVLGAIPQTSTLFGYMPLWGGEIFVHAIFSFVSLCFLLYQYPKKTIIRRRQF